MKKTLGGQGCLTFRHVLCDLKRTPSCYPKLLGLFISLCLNLWLQTKAKVTLQCWNVFLIPVTALVQQMANTEVLMFFQEVYAQEDCILECGEMMTTLSCLCHQGKRFLSCYFCCSCFHFPLGFSLVSIFLEFSLTSLLISNNKEEMGHSLEKEWGVHGREKRKRRTRCNYI